MFAHAGECGLEMIAADVVEIHVNALGRSVREPPPQSRRIENAGVLAQASIYGSILPAAWSFMLAARARGLGSAWTTIHLFHEKEIAELLGIPATVTQAVLLPVAYFTGGDFKPARRIPATQLTYWNVWGQRRSP